MSFLGTRYVGILALVTAAALMTGCGADIVEPLGSTPVPIQGSLTGNWQFTATTTTGTAPFTGLSGALVLQSASADGSNPVVSILQANNPGSCYAGQTAIPSQGSYANSGLSLTSFSVAGQYLSLSGTLPSTEDRLTGSFSISGGCGNGVKGTLTGTKIATATGTYRGTTNPGGAALSLQLAQDASSDGLGYFHVGGTATFSGVTCFNAANVQNASSTVTGQQVQLTLVTNETSPSTVVAQGTLSVDATSINLSSVQITSGGCAGNLGSATVSQ